MDRCRDSRNELRPDTGPDPAGLGVAPPSLISGGSRTPPMYGRRSGPSASPPQGWFVLVTCDPALDHTRSLAQGHGRLLPAIEREQVIGGSLTPSLASARPRPMRSGPPEAHGGDRASASQSWLPHRQAVWASIHADPDRATALWPPLASDRALPRPVECCRSSV
ncbi:MAG: hypothetical protein JWP31_972 [Aeromicrobium sp.]|nr:hypothetical protein [Aeromicrobium sp.]